MKCLLDINSMYDFKDEYIKDLNIYYKPVSCDLKIIGKINSVRRLPDNYLDIRYKITDKNYEYGQGKNVNIHFTKIKNENNQDIHIFEAEVKVRQKRNRKITNDTTITLRTNKEQYKNFSDLCKNIGTNPSKMINTMISNFIEENVAIKDEISNEVVNDIKEEGGK